MTVLDMEETKRKIKYVTSEIQKADWEGVENGLYDIIVHIQRDHQELAITTPRNHDIAALIQEMRNGFQAMDRRFEAMDKRFDDLIHQMDKRFEAMDKRFDDMLQHTDKRFNLVFWIMGLGFTFFSFIITYGTFFR